MRVRVRVRYVGDSASAREIGVRRPEGTADGGTRRPVAYLLPMNCQ